MSEERQIVFTVSCAASELVQTVTLYHDTWYGKIAQKQVAVASLLSDVEATASAPDAIAESRTVPGRYVFINLSVTTSKGHPLRVIVDPGEGHGTIASVYFGTRTNEIIAWIPPKGESHG